MSTRCQIGFYQNSNKTLKDFEALLYRHSDGYPGKADGSEYGVLSDIVPFLKWWKKGRGLSDSEYVSARLLQHLCNLYDGEYKEKMERVMGEKEGFTGTLGHGICKDFHGDIQYFYRIYPNKLEVYERKNWNMEVPDGFELIKTINL